MGYFSTILGVKKFPYFSDGCHTNLAFHHGISVKNTYLLLSKLQFPEAIRKSAVDKLIMFRPCYTSSGLMRPHADGKVFLAILFQQSGRLRPQLSGQF